MRPSLELPASFVIRAPVQQQIHRLLASHPGQACLGLFAAADGLQLGHVSGVPPYIYVPKLPRTGDSQWRMLMVLPSGVPDLILRQALAPQSTFRGAVQRDGPMLSDVIQVWLDVANHPSRGEEQAQLIYRKVLLPLIGNGN